ncbi:CRIB domain-containing protein RIC6-like [Silene latifolia]|uniref:CRIB domain-containing protein RIC6-like n=1 Tax=Silene latifolia TaxID=37657 RepID=UPI003D76FC60
MSNKMKGVLKGLRYISQIFEDGEQQEMQIGFPTDVKHVAHIGWDGPAAGNAPSWIQKFKEGDPGAPSNGDQQNVPLDPRLTAQERRCSTGTDSILKSRSKRQSSDKGKAAARRHSSAGNDSPNRTLTTENSTKQSPGPEDSPSRDTSSSAKASRRRKTKTSSSKSKPTSTTPDSGYSDPGITSNGLKSKDTCQSLGLSGSEKDQNAIDDKTRRIPAM